MRDDPAIFTLAEVPLGWEPVNECTRDRGECQALLLDLAGRNVALVSHPNGCLQVWEERNIIWRD